MGSQVVGEPGRRSREWSAASSVTRGWLWDLSPPVAHIPSLCPLCLPLALSPRPPEQHPLPQPCPLLLPHVQHRPFVCLLSHAPDLPGRPLPAAPPGRPCLRTGPRVQPEPRVCDGAGAAQAARCGEHPRGGGHQAASGPEGQRSGLCGHPSAQEQIPRQLGPVPLLTFPQAQGPSLTSSSVRALSPLSCAASSPWLAAEWGTLSSPLIPCGASDEPPDLGQGTQVVTLGCFFPGALRDSTAVVQGRNLFISVTAGSPRSWDCPVLGRGHPETYTGTRRMRAPCTQTQVTSRSSGLQPALNGSLRCAV